MNNTTQPRMHLYTSAGPHAPGAVEAARAIATRRGLSFRAPHNTVSHAGVAGEMALAAGGVLLLDDPIYFPQHVINTIGRLWCDMHANVRPTIVVILRGDSDPEVLASTLKRFAMLFDGWNIGSHKGAPGESGDEDGLIATYRNGTRSMRLVFNDDQVTVTASSIGIDPSDELTAAAIAAGGSDFTHDGDTWKASIA